MLAEELARMYPPMSKHVQLMPQHQNFSLKLPSRFQTVVQDADE
jgi:hypothetical protein